MVFIHRGEHSTLSTRKSHVRPLQGKKQVLEGACDNVLGEY